jgi:MSHA pilin protein MshD
MQRRTPARRGLTMAEVLVSAAIVGVMLSAALESVGMAIRTRRLSADMLTGPGLAQELLAEALAMPYEDPEDPAGGIGTDAGESAATRAQFDDVDDYHNWNSNGPQTSDGAAINGYPGWRRQVQVAFANLSNPGTNSAADLGLKRVTVTVTSPDGAVKTVVGLRAKNGLADQPQGLDSAAVAALTASLQLGAGDRGQRWGAYFANSAADAN